MRLVWLFTFFVEFRLLHSCSSCIKEQTLWLGKCLSGRKVSLPHRTTERCYERYAQNYNFSGARETSELAFERPTPSDFGRENFRNDPQLIPRIKINTRCEHEIFHMYQATTVANVGLLI